MSTKEKPMPIRLTEEEKERLSIALGGPEAFLMLEQSEFIAQTGCPPQELESWLENCWVQHDIRAVLAGVEEIGPQPVLLVGFEKQDATVRLFCPTERLLWDNVIEDALSNERSSSAEREASAPIGAAAEDPARNLRALIAARPWEQSAEELIADIVSVANACAARELPIIEIKQFCLAFGIGSRILSELRNGRQKEVLGRLVAALGSLDCALGERGADASTQGKYAEAQVSSRRALRENHDPVLDPYPELVELSVEVCSHEVAEYMGEEVGLPYDAFLETLHMLAHDGADPATVVNPPARICRALARADQRRKRRERQRWISPTPTQTESLKDPQEIESAVTAKVDWERGRRELGLPLDQTRAVEARLGGLNLQASDAPDELGWDAERLESVRRSLEPDRRWGQKLRKRFSAYDSKRNSAKKS